MPLNDNIVTDKPFHCIAGVDEVGRGPLCGPVVSAAVVFPPGTEIEGVDDSKKISPKKRETLYEKIKKKALSIGLGFVHENEIDKINILEATILSMKKAVDALKVTPDILLVDGNMSSFTDIYQMNIRIFNFQSTTLITTLIIKNYHI